MVYYNRIELSIIIIIDISVKIIIFWGLFGFFLFFIEM